MTTNGGKIRVFLGVMMAFLSPSFIDWQQETERRWQILVYYGVASLLLLSGIWDGD